MHSDYTPLETVTSNRWLVDLRAKDWAIVELVQVLYRNNISWHRDDCAFKHGFEKPYGVWPCARSNLQYTKTWLTHVESSFAVMDLRMRATFEVLVFQLSDSNRKHHSTFTLSSSS